MVGNEESGCEVSFLERAVIAALQDGDGPKSFTSVFVQLGLYDLDAPNKWKDGVLKAILLQLVSKGLVTGVDDGWWMMEPSALRKHPELRSD